MLCKDGEHSQATEIIEVTGKGKAKLPANTDRVMKTRCDPVFENTCHIHSRHLKKLVNFKADLVFLGTLPRNERSYHTKFL